MKSSRGCTNAAILGAIASGGRDVLTDDVRDNGVEASTHSDTAAGRELHKVDTVEAPTKDAAPEDGTASFYKPRTTKGGEVKDDTVMSGELDTVEETLVPTKDAPPRRRSSRWRLSHIK